MSLDSSSEISRLSVLVVDDDDGIRRLLEHWLTRDGHEVACAACGQEASRILRIQKVDLVITDIVMPDGDGFELISLFKQLQPEARMLAISGGGKYLQGSDCLKIARGLGAHGIVMKPFTWDQLRAGLEQALPGYAAVTA